MKREFDFFLPDTAQLELVQAENSAGGRAMWPQCMATSLAPPEDRQSTVQSPGQVRPAGGFRALFSVLTRLTSP